MLDTIKLVTVAPLWGLPRHVVGVAVGAPVQAEPVKQLHAQVVIIILHLEQLARVRRVQVFPIHHKLVQQVLLTVHAFKPVRENILVVPAVQKVHLHVRAVLHQHIHAIVIRVIIRRAAAVPARACQIQLLAAPVHIYLLIQQHAQRVLINRIVQVAHILLTTVQIRALSIVHRVQQVPHHRVVHLAIVTNLAQPKV